LLTPYALQPESGNTISADHLRRRLLKQQLYQDLIRFDLLTRSMHV